VLKVNQWNTWSSADNPKYAVHNKKKKVYETNEVCYIDSGKFKITPDIEVKPVALLGPGAIDTPLEPIPRTVVAGDFVIFPKGFSCTWEVEEPVTKHWFEY
jgi:uncharacterized cupin superfamily protein